MKPELPNVCFIAGTLGRGGAERQLYYMLRTLVGYGARPRLLTLTAGEAWEEPIRELGVPVDMVGTAPGRFRRLRAIRRALREDPPDILQSAHFFTNLYAFFAARRLGIREIGAVRSDVLHELASHGWLGRRGLFWPRTLALNTTAAIEVAASRGVPRERLVFVPNVVDVSRHARPPRAPDARVEILWAGRLVDVKRPDRLIRVLEGLQRAIDVPWHATIVGDGPAHASLSRLIVQSGLDARVSIKRGVEDLRDDYASADILIGTSDHEGSPNVVLEAMASGLPVIATAVGGVPELVREGETGHLHAPDDITGMIRTLARLIDSPKYARRLGDAGRTAALEARSAEHLLPALESLYRHARR